MSRGERSEGYSPTDITTLIDRVSDANHGLVIGEEATAAYIEYLRSGGDIEKLIDAIIERSNEVTGHIVMVQIIHTLIDRG